MFTEAVIRRALDAAAPRRGGLDRPVDASTLAIAISRHAEFLNFFVPECDPVHLRRLAKRAETLARKLRIVMFPGLAEKKAIASVAWLTSKAGVPGLPCGRRRSAVRAWDMHSQFIEQLDNLLKQIIDAAQQARRDNLNDAEREKYIQYPRSKEEALRWFVHRTAQEFAKATGRSMRSYKADSPVVRFISFLLKEANHPFSERSIIDSLKRDIPQVGQKGEK